MLTKNNFAIEKLHISTQELIQIKADLKTRNSQYFNQKIVAPFSSTLGKWIDHKYPALANEKEDILFGVFRRLKNKIIEIDLLEDKFNLDRYLKEFIQIECQAAIPNEANRKKNLGLDKAQFKNLLSALKNGDETLIEKVYLSHFNKCIAFLVINKKCTKEEAYDSSIDALIEIRKDLIKGNIRYGNLGSYFTSRAISKLYKRIQKNRLPTSPLANNEDFIEESENELIKTELTKIIHNAIEKLCEECRFILRQFYYEDKNLNDIGKKMNKSHDAVRKQATRCRKKLKEYIGERFYKQYSSFFS